MKKKWFIRSLANGDKALCCNKSISKSELQLIEVLGALLKQHLQKPNDTPIVISKEHSPLQVV